ncbi:MAG: hypothetical protein ACRD2D_13970 [Terriglobales bacterium]
MQAAAVCVLALTTAAALALPAQTRSPSAGKDEQPPTIEMLLRTAKAALPEVPEAIAVPYLLQVGRTESWRGADAGEIQAGVDDMARAFDQARQMSTGDGDSPESKLRERSKNHT